MESNIKFISCLFPEGLRSEILANSKYGAQYAADKLQWNFVKGLAHHYGNNLQIINAPAINSFPIYYKKAFIPRHEFSYSGNFSHISVGFCNVAIIKNYFIKNALVKELDRVLKSKQHKTILLVYGLLPAPVISAIKIKERFPGVRICVIVPDLPEYMNTSDKYFEILRDRLKTNLYPLLEEVDAFVYLTDSMAEHPGFPKRPWIRIEGIAVSQENRQVESKKDSEKKIILYTGTLAAQYGIADLLDAFGLISDNRYELWIYGEGDTRELVIKKAKHDPRIKYFSRLSNSEVSIMQRNATVLINPRNSISEYTRFSFPSKTMEYLMSGTPVIMYRLPGVPEEYFKHVYCIEKPGPEEMRKRLVEVCDKGIEELQLKGEAARKFVLEYKNPVVQTRKLYELLTQIAS